MSTRNAYIDRTIEQTQAVLADTGVQASLGSRAAPLRGVIDNLFVPNIRKGEITIPREYIDHEGYPIVVARPDEDMRVGFLPQSPRQLKVGEARVAALQPIHPFGAAYVAESFARTGIMYSTSDQLLLGAESEGMCQYSRVTVRLSSGDFQRNVKEAERLVIGRPIVVLSERDDRTNAEPDVLIHEATHVIQHVGRNLSPPPERPRNLHARNELEAYHVASLAMERAIDGGLVDTSNYHTRNQVQQTIMIENIRRNHADASDPFGISRELFLALKQANLLQAVVQTHRL